MKKPVATISLRVGDRKPYGCDLTGFCTNYYRPGEIYGLGEAVRPREIVNGGRGPTGLEYVVTVAGQCGLEPQWPTAVGQTVTSGSVTFTAQAISNASLAKTITGSVWEDPDGGEVTTDDDTTVTSNGEQKTQAFLLAVSVTTGVEVVNRVTFSDGHIDLLAFKVKVGANG
jgi:hypothetical protein